MNEASVARLDAHALERPQPMLLLPPPSAALGLEGDTLAAVREEVVRIVGEREVMVEPWGQLVTVPPGATLELRFAGPDAGATETEDTGEALIVYGWAGSTVLAVLDGEVVLDMRDIPTPATSGGSMRDFLARLFGGRS